MRKLFLIIPLVITAIITFGDSHAKKNQTEEFEHARIELLIARIMDQTFKDINSVLVIKNGKLLIEEYFNGEGPDTLHDIRSAGKSITSALVGIAIDKGFILGVDEKLLSYFPGIECQNDWDSRKEKITLQHVLTMSFGFAEPEEYPAWENRSWYTVNWKNDVLCQPIEYEPGSRFDYDSAAPALLGPILEQATGFSVERFSEEFLFNPLGIKHYRWHTMRDGHDYTGGGFRMRPRDMARFGQMYLQKGLWEGKQLVSKEWVEESTRSHLPVNKLLDVSYGYYWWREIFLIGNRQIEVYSASGNGGNKIYVSPTEGLVVIITASAYNQSYCHSQARMMMGKYILPAVIRKGGSLPKEPVLKTVPKMGFFISEIVFLVTLAFCILWLLWLKPSTMPARRQLSADGKNNPKKIYFIWIGLNSLVGIIFVGIVLGEIEILNIVLNCGYVQPIQTAVRKVLASWAIILLTIGSFILSVKSLRNHHLSNLTKCLFGIFTIASIYCIAELKYLGLLFFL